MIADAAQSIVVSFIIRRRRSFIDHRPSFSVFFPSLSRLVPVPKRSEDGFLSACVARK